MGGAWQDLLERLLEALEGIREELSGIREELSRLETPAPPVVEQVQPDPWPAIAAVVLGLVAAAVAVAALVIAWRALGVLSSLRDDRVVAGRRGERAAYAARVRRYSELLGVEAVTGREAARGETAASLRSSLEHHLSVDREHGALELLEEVAASRRGISDLPREARASANGLAGMTVEWSIDRWVADPDAWLRDHRERHRLRTLAARTPAGDGEPAEGDTRVL
jgi:hypothetical protein